MDVFPTEEKGLDGVILSFNLNLNLSSENLRPLQYYPCMITTEGVIWKEGINEFCAPLFYKKGGVLINL